MPGPARWADSPCTPVRRCGATNAKSNSGCAATSAGQSFRSNGCPSRGMATLAKIRRRRTATARPTSLLGHWTTSWGAMSNSRRRAERAKGRMPGALHRASGGSGAQTAGQHDVLPRGLLAEQQVSGAGDTGQAGPGRPACHESGSGRADTGQTPCRDDLRATPQGGSRDRYRDLFCLQRGDANHRAH